eukprot:scaffold9294_cov73-Skeletonema_marinoi.AAC.1
MGSISDDESTPHRREGLPPQLHFMLVSRLPGVSELSLSCVLWYLLSVAEEERSKLTAWPLLLRSAPNQHQLLRIRSPRVFSGKGENYTSNTSGTSPLFNTNTT